MRLTFDTSNVEDYRKFLAVKRLPRFRFVGRTAEIPDEYASRLGITVPLTQYAPYTPWPGLFDYQADISKLAIRKRKFAVFAKMGYGKTFIQAEFARYVASVLPANQCILMIAPLMVVEQTMEEIDWFYKGNFPVIRHLRANNLNDWLVSGTERIGITNWEALSQDTPRGKLGCLIPDETSIMKSHDGVYAQILIRLGRGIDWKLCSTGTPAPNDRIEYANHAVYLDAFPTVNSFLAKYFVNRGQTNERWEMKPHALRPFYRDLSHWSIFLNNPATYGWKDNVDTIPPIKVHIHDVDLTDEQSDLVRTQTRQLFVSNIGGIAKRSTLSQIAKGQFQGKKIASNKPEYIRQLVESWPGESTIIWCRFNAEQDHLASLFPQAANIDGSTPYEKRKTLIQEFKSKQRPQLITKPDVLGYGSNLQVATRHVFSSCEDSYESYAQAVARSNRVGSTQELNVHLVVTEAEYPMMENVLRKADRVQQDNEEQERLFREIGYDAA